MQALRNMEGNALTPDSAFTPYHKRCSESIVKNAYTSKSKYKLYT
jgi:hypothetical protein